MDQGTSNNPVLASLFHANSGTRPRRRTGQRQNRRQRGGASGQNSGSNVPSTTPANVHAEVCQMINCAWAHENVPHQIEPSRIQEWESLPFGAGEIIVRQMINAVKSQVQGFPIANTSWYRGQPSRTAWDEVEAYQPPTLATGRSFARHLTISGYGRALVRQLLNFAIRDLGLQESANSPWGQTMIYGSMANPYIQERVYEFVSWLEAYERGYPTINPPPAMTNVTATGHIPITTGMLGAEVLRDQPYSSAGSTLIRAAGSAFNASQNHPSNGYAGASAGNLGNGSTGTSAVNLGNNNTGVFANSVSNSSTGAFGTSPSNSNTGVFTGNLNNSGMGLLTIDMNNSAMRTLAANLTNRNAGGFAGNLSNGGMGLLRAPPYYNGTRASAVNLTNSNTRVSAADLSNGNMGAPPRNFDGLLTLLEVAEEQFGSIDRQPKNQEKDKTINEKPTKPGAIASRGNKLAYRNGGGSYSDNHAGPRPMESKTSNPHRNNNANDDGKPGGSSSSGETFKEIAYGNKYAQGLWNDESALRSTIPRENQMNDDKALSENRRKNFNVFQGLLNLPELILLLARHLRVQELVILYRISEKFHKILDIRITTTVVSQAISRAPESARMFPFRCYWTLCQEDPSPRLHPVESKAMQGEHRTVPTFRWLLLICYREMVCNQIITIMAADGVPLPEQCELVLKKIWLLLDIPDNTRRIGLVQNQDIFTDVDLFFAIMFFVKLDMRFTDPITGAGKDGMRRLLLSQPSLTLTWKALRRVALKSKLDVMKEFLHWKGSGSSIVQDPTVLDVPADKLGTLKYEVWGRTARRAELQRPDELILKEAIRRGLKIHETYADMFVWGYINPYTMKNNKLRKRGLRLDRLDGLEDVFEQDFKKQGQAKDAHPIFLSSLNHINSVTKAKS